MMKSLQYDNGEETYIREVCKNANIYNKEHCDGMTKLKLFTQEQ